MAFWEQDTVTYSNQNPKPDVEDSSKFIQSNFRQFLREFRKGGVEETFHYREQLMRNYEQRNYKIVIDFEDLNNWNNSLGEKFREHPMIYLPLFEAAAQEVVAMSKVPKPTREEMHDIQVQIINLARSEISIRQLQSDHIAQLVRVPGIIISSTKPSCKAKKITLMCSNCRATRVIESARAFGTIQLPRNCENSTNENNEKACPVDPFMILADKSEFLDVQKLKLQENPEDIPTGEMPRHIWLFCERNLVNKVKPGSRVNVIGIYKIFDSKLFNNNNNNGNGKNNKRNDCHDAAVRKPYIEVVGFEEINATEKKGTFQPEEEEEIRELSRNSNIQEMISNSIAPAIWSNEDVKKAIACLLFGGSRKLLPDGMRLRGDINVLLLGDPSVAKSQFLKFVHQVAPIGVYTSGKGSSAAGLTASVLRDPGTGDFHLEGGAMVLADNGVVCIDEFDKMREQDRVAIHEAMEQQTISIAKAGITTILNSRTSVLAAANPIFGRYDDMRTTNENIEFETTILSRFDLIFIIRDVKDKNRDARLAQHIMQLHINVNNIEDKQNEAPISPQLLAKYISYAKHKIYPRLSNNAAEMLKNHYVSFRDEARRYQDQTGQQNAIPLTVRQLESLIRIAESLAKMELSKEANENHVKEAVRLFKVSTLKAARQSTTTTEQQLLNSNNSQYIQDIQKAEKRIKRRIPVGSALSVQKLIRDMLQKNVSESTTHRALAIMHARGEVEYKNKAKQILRLK